MPARKTPASGPDKGLDSGPSEALPRQRIVAGVPRLWPPEYSLDASGKPEGFAIDIIELVAAEAGLSITYRIADTFPKVGEMFRRGEIDIIPNSGISDERARTANFTKPVQTAVLSIFVRAESTAIDDIGALGGRRVAASNNSLGTTFLVSHPNIRVQILGTPSDVLFALLAGHVDAAVLPKSLLFGLARQAGVGRKIKTVGAPLLEIKRAIRVQKNNPELLAVLNRAIDKVVASPEYRAIYSKWYGQKAPFWTVRRVFLAMISVVAAVVLLMLIYRYYSIHRLNSDLARTVDNLAKAESLSRNAERLARFGHWERDDIATGKGHFSDALCAIYGVDPDHFGHSSEAFFELLHVDDREWVKSRVSQVIRQCASTTFECRVVRPDGTLRYIREYIEVSGDDRGHSVAMQGVVQDITEIEESKSNLQRREEEYRALVDASPTGIVIARDDRIIYVNDAKAAMHGYKAAELIGTAFDDLLHPDEIERAHRLRKQSPITDVELRGRRCDGAELWFSANTLPVQWEGKPARLYVSTEITERKKAEQRLRRDATILAQLSEGIMVLDLDLRIVDVNPGLTNIFGYSRDELLGESPVLFGADEEWWQHRSVQIVDETIKTGRWSGEVTAKRKDGAVFYGGLVLVPLADEEGGATGIIGVIRDISDRKKAEDRLRNAIKLTRLGIWERDITTGETYWSPELFNIYGLDRETTPPGFPTFSALVHPDDLPGVEDAIEKTIDDQESTITEFRLIRPDGKTISLRQFIKVVTDINKRPLQIRGVTQDVTEQEAMQEQLRQSQKMEVIGQLTGGVAHDFNNLLAIMLGNLELAVEQLPENTKVQKNLESAIRAAERGASLTHSLLAFARKQPLAPRALDINDFLPSVDQLLARTLGEKISLQTVPGPGLWHCAADSGQFEHAILNLALNARDSMPDGGRLTIETGNVVLDRKYCEKYEDLSPGDYVMVAVSDTGCGMPQDVLQHVYEPFFTTKKIGQGTGLGLSMVFGFAKQSGGHVSIYSEIDKGTTVKLFLPRRLDGGTSATGTPDGHPVSTVGKTVLLVEDDEDVRHMTMGLLASLGCRVLEAFDGESALKQADESGGGIDILLTDVVLAGEMDGPEVARLIAKRLPDIRILYMSGYTENAILHHGKLDPGVTLLQKPFTKNDLVEKVSTVLRSSPMADPEGQTS